MRLPAQSGNPAASPLSGGLLGGRFLLATYFAVTFSYAHLPWAKIHHGLGSLFNFVAVLLLLVSLPLSPRWRFTQRDIGLLVGPFLVLLLALAAQTVRSMIAGQWGRDPELWTRSFTSVISMMAPLLVVAWIAKLADSCDFSFQAAAKSSRIGLLILCGYLAIEVLGSSMGLQPFLGVVEFVSEHLNYRDDADQLGGRVRGFSNEPSYLAVVILYFVTVLLVERRISGFVRYGTLFVLIFLSSASLSKNVLVGLFVILGLHAVYFRHLIVPMLGAMLLFGAMYYLYLIQNPGIWWQYEQAGIDISTLSRVGSWVAAWNGFIDNPLLGVGLGHTGGLLPNFYPQWFYFSPEAAQWEASSLEFGTPVFSNLFRNLFEAGFLGVVYIVVLLRGMVRASNGRSLLDHDNMLLMVGFLVCYSMVDVLTFWPWFVLLTLKRSRDEVR